MATVDDLRGDVNQIKTALGALSAGLAGFNTALAAVNAALASLIETLDELDLPADQDDDVAFMLGQVTATTVKVSWSGDAGSWVIARDGQDSMGSGAWNTTLAGATREFQFSSLKAGTEYTFTLRPVGGAALTLKATTLGPPTSGGAPVGVAARLGWGAPHAVSDEFAVDGRPDPSKWRYCGDYGVGWDGHDKNGRRMPENSFVKDGLLVLRGDANGNTGWLRQSLPVKQGRWEICCRSRNTGSSGGLYHPLFLIWPTAQPGPEGFKEYWPRDGELDLLEYEDPNSTKAKAYLHYPHDKGEQVQQIPFTKDGVDMTKWHVFSFEWTRQHVRAWIDGEEWYFASGGANSIRRDIQAMPEGRATIQLDNFTGDGGLRPAVFEFQYVNFYSV